MSLPLLSKRATRHSIATGTFFTILDFALTRRRVKCTMTTEYESSNLLEYIKSSLPEWAIVFAGTEAGLSELPIDNQIPETERVRMVAKYLETDEVAAKDRLNGHCETIAVLMTDTVKSALTTGQEVCKALTNLFCNTKMLPFHQQVQLIFKAEKQTANHPHCKKYDASSTRPSQHEAKADTRTKLFWPSTGTSSSVRSWCAGGPETSANLSTAASASVCDNSIMLLPLYLLTYIFDADELTNEDMKADEETAMYSVHVLGMVLDGRKKTCYVVDPNGKFIKGSNMEYLQIPLIQRYGEATTCTSRSDLEAIQLQPGNKKKRKRPV